MKWLRTDWAEPLGAVAADGYYWEPRQSTVHGVAFKWDALVVSTLWLGHKAALFVLQGMSLSKLLIPNIRVQAPGHMGIDLCVHVLLRVDPWEAWQPRPRLTGLLFARLAELPDLAPQEVLGALARDSVP